MTRHGNAETRHFGRMHSRWQVAMIASFTSHIEILNELVNVVLNPQHNLGDDMQINHTMLWGLMGYLIAIHLVVFMLIRAVGQAKKRINDLEDKGKG